MQCLVDCQTLPNQMNELLRAFPVLIQRTNLDVNLAVNNLLSRDEEDGDDDDASQSGGKFFLQKV